MNYDRRQLVKQSFERMRPRIRQVVASFYDRLFAKHPDYRALFPDDITLQHVKFIQFMSQLIGMIDHLDTVNESCRTLGRSHAGYGVKPEDYGNVGAVLLETLEAELGEDWTPEVASAWGELYGAISEAMIAANSPQAA
jgi:methyl-accepting chemotaxis protein/nitric oxide dioxygenase